MYATNLKGRTYFSKLFGKSRRFTPQHEREVQYEMEVRSEREVEAIQPISRVEVLVQTLDVGNVTNERVKKRKQENSGRRSHSSPRRHRHASISSSQPLPETIFDASSRFFKMCARQS